MKYKKRNWKIWFTFETKVSTTRSNWTHGCCWTFPFHTVLLPSITWRSGWFDKLDHDNHLHQALDQPSDDQKDDDHDAWPESHLVSPVDDDRHNPFWWFFICVFRKSKNLPKHVSPVAVITRPWVFQFFLIRMNFRWFSKTWIQPSCLWVHVGINRDLVGQLLQNLTNKNFYYNNNKKKKKNNISDTNKHLQNQHISHKT